MNSFHSQYLEARYRYENYLREAENDRLVQLARLARKNQPRAESMMAKYFLWLGRYMTRWGSQLINRYGSGQIDHGSVLRDPAQPSINCG